MIRIVSVGDIPLVVSAVVFDFDGVFTSNKVSVNQYGIESVECWRGDGLGIEKLKALGVATFILSHEKNPAALHRAKKLGVNLYVTSHEKKEFLTAWANLNHVQPESMIFLGNDINDISAMKFVGCPVAVSDAHPELKIHCKYETSAKGGMGAVRELCDLVYERFLEK